MKHLYLFLLLPIVSVQAQFDNGRALIYTGNNITKEFHDVDNDGDMDILIKDTYASLYHVEISSLINDGSGHYEYGPLLPISGESLSDWNWSFENTINVSVFSLDNDEFPDLLISRSVEGDVYSWHYALGDGSGGFTAVEPYTSLNTLFDPLNCWVRDLNQDGRPDVISDIDGNDSSISVNYSSGLDSWLGWETINLMSPLSPDYTVNAMRAFDVDLDSEVDFLDVRLVNNFPNPEVLQVFYAENEMGNYTLEAFAEIIINENASDLNWFVEDWNSDGYEDLLVLVRINFSGPQRAYLFENIEGELNPDYLEISLPLMSMANPLYSFADLNGDGLLDLFGNEYAYLNTDSPNWTSIQMPFSLDPSLPIHTAEAADFNGDGKYDLLGTSHTSTCTVLSTYIYSTTEGTYIYGEQFSFGKPWVDNAADADGDGDADFVGIKAGEMFFGLNEGMNFSWQKVGLGNTGKFGDVDGDGDLDIVTNDGYFSETVLLYENNDGVFTLTQQLPGSLVDYTKFFDTNADGSDDLVYFDGEELIVRRAMNGLFGEEESLCPTCGINSFQMMEFTDMDDDGWVDVIYLDNLIPEDWQTNLFYTRNVNGIMVPQSNTPVEMGDYYGGFIGFIDYNSDGLKDVYFSTEDILGAPQIAISTSAFSSASSDWLPIEFQSTYNIKAFDYNQDGWSDFIIGRYDSPMMSILVGTGVGTFEQGPSYVLGPENSSLNAIGINNSYASLPCYLLDFDGDGDQDFGLQLGFESAFVYFENLEINIPINILENEQELNTDGLLLYPNPSSDIVNLVFSEPGLHQVDVYDMYGKLIWTNSRSNSNWTIDVSTWAKGIYVARAENGKSSKLIVE